MAATIPTIAHLLGIFRAEAMAADPRLTDWSRGSALHAMRAATAVCADEVIRYSIHRWSASYVATAEGTDLDFVIADRGGPPRAQASAATVTVRVERDSAVGAHTIPSGTSVTGTRPDGTPVTFETIESVTIGALDAQATVRCEATEAGRGGNVPAGTLTTIAGLPDGFTVVQADRAAGGSDGEPYTEAGDDAYRARYILIRQGQGNGRRQDIIAAALSVPGVTYVQIDESRIAESDGGFVAVYIGDPDAEANATLVARVEDVIGGIGSDARDSVRAAGVEVRVFASEREEIPLEIEVVVSAGAAIAEDDVRASILSFFDTLNPGEAFYASQLEAWIHRTLDPRSEDRVLSATVIDPVARVTYPTHPYNALRTASDGSNVTVTITEG